MSKGLGLKAYDASETLNRLQSAMQNPGPMNYCTSTKSPPYTAATNWRPSLSAPPSEYSSLSLSEAESVALQMFNACLTPEQTKLLSIVLQFGDLHLSMKSQTGTETNVSWSLSRRSELPTDGSATQIAGVSAAEYLRVSGRGIRFTEEEVNSSSPV